MRFCLLFFLSFKVIANDCGVYEFIGTVKIINQKNYTLIINEGTRSEYQFKLTHEQELMFAPYLNKGVKGKIETTTPFDGKIGVIEKSSDLDYVVIDPLRLKKEKTLQLIQKNPCKGL